MLELGRGSYYRALDSQTSEKERGRGGSVEEEAVRAALEQVMLEFPGYGYLRAPHQLRRFARALRLR